MGVKITLSITLATLFSLIACSGPWRSYPGTVEYPDKKTKIDTRTFVTRTQDKGELLITFRQRDVEFLIRTPKPIKDHSSWAHVKYRFDRGSWVKSDDWVTSGPKPSSLMTPQYGTQLSLLNETLEARKLYFEYEPAYAPPEILEFDVHGLKKADDFLNQYTLRAKREESFHKCYYEGKTPPDNGARYDYCNGLPDQR